MTTPYTVLRFCRSEAWAATVFGKYDGWAEARQAVRDELRLSLSPMRRK